MSQLPAGAQGVAIAVLVYSGICLISNLVIVWLVWIHNERLSYVALISYAMLLSTACSIIEQVHHFINWKDVIVASFEYSKHHQDETTSLISTGSVGPDRFLFYIQYYCYLGASSAVLFWAFSLTQSVYGWSARPHLKRPLSIINIAGKVMSAVVPAITVGLFQVNAIRTSPIAMTFVSDIQFFISIIGGCIFLIMIFVKYVQTRRQFKTWSVGYGKNSQVAGNPYTAHHSMGPRQRSQGIYDRWLLVRFTIAFIVLCVFECALILFQVLGTRDNKKDLHSTTPDFGAARAKRSFLLSMPGVSASLLAFIVFGTTKPSRQKIYTTFVPKMFQRKKPAPTFTGVAYATQDSRVSMSQRRHGSIQLSKSTESEINLNELNSLRSTYNNFDDYLPILAPPPTSPRRTRPNEVSSRIWV